MDLLLSVAKITPDSGEPQRIRMNPENMRLLGVREQDPVLLIHAQHSTQAGAIVGPPLPPPDHYVLLDVVTRYALGAIEGHQVRVTTGNLELGTSLTVIPRRRWKMPVKVRDFRHVLQDHIVAPRQRIPLIKRGIWLDFEVTSVLPEAQMIRVTRVTNIIVKPLMEKTSPSTFARTTESHRGEEEPVLDATDLVLEENAREELRPPPQTLPKLEPPPPPTVISQTTREYYRATWGFDPQAVLIRLGNGAYAYEAQIPLVNDPRLMEAGVTMYAHTQIPGDRSHLIFEWNMNNIVFRCGSKEARASCVHTIIQHGSLDDALRLTDAIERRTAHPRPGSLAQLDPLEHFAALRSYCFAIAEMGILRGIESTINFEDTGIRRELAFGFNSNLQTQIMNALTTVAPAAASRQLREIFLWNIDKAPKNWLQGPGGKLFARRMSLANLLFSDPDLAPQLLQALQAKGVPLPTDGDDKRKIATFFGITGNHGEGRLRENIMQELRDLFERRATNNLNPERIQELRRRIEERLRQWQDRLNPTGPAPPAPGPPPNFPPPPRLPPGSAGNPPRDRNLRRWDDDDLNFFAV